MMGTSLFWMEAPTSSAPSSMTILSRPRATMCSTASSSCPSTRRRPARTTQGTRLAPPLPCSQSKSVWRDTAGAAALVLSGPLCYLQTLPHTSQRYPPNQGITAEDRQVVEGSHHDAAFRQTLCKLTAHQVLNRGLVVKSMGNGKVRQLKRDLASAASALYFSKESTSREITYCSINSPHFCSSRLLSLICHRREHLIT